MKRSAISGRGLFSSANVKKGDVVIRIGFKERYYTPAQCLSFSPRYRITLKKYAYWDKKKGWWVYPLDDTKHLNHSCDPNIINKGDTDVAVRDIRKGEELTYDYRPILARNETLRCSCGSPKCFGVIRPHP